MRQHLDKSEWYDQFLFDLRFSDKCFFVGYSLADQHIAALLTADPRWSGKIHFVEPDRIPDRIFASRVSKYGEIEPIGVDGFSKLVADRSAPVPISDFRSLKAFRYLEPQPDKKTYSKPTVSEVRDFLVHGAVNLAKLVSSYPKPIYAVPRIDKINEAVEVLKHYRTLIIDARLGNGKSTFQYMLFSQLSEKGYRCLQINAVDAINQSEIEFLTKQDRVIIMFQNFSDAQRTLESLGTALPNAKFVVEARSSLVEVRSFEVQSIVPRPFGRISLNELTETDIFDFEQLCKNAGIPIDTDFDRDLEMRDLLIKVFESEVIQAKIKSDLELAFSNDKIKQVIILVFLMQLVQAPIDTGFVRQITGSDPFQAVTVETEGLEEFLSIKGGGMALRSSIFAEFAMRQFIPTSDLSNAVHDCAVFCANRKDDRRYRNLLTLFIQYSRIRPMYSTRDSAGDEMRSLYERLRWYPPIEEEPLFWLQFAILEIDEERLSDGKGHLDYAYDRASHRQTFKTYQIDTQYYRLIIKSILENSNIFGKELYPNLLKYTEIVSKMLLEETHRDFAFKQLEMLPEVAQKIHISTDAEAEMIVKDTITYLIETIKSISDEIKSRYGYYNLLERLIIVERLYS